MKRSVAVLSMVVLASSLRAAPTLELARDGRTDYAIVVAEDAAKPELFAADELRLHLEKSTGADFAITNALPASGKAFVLRRAPASADLKPEECRVRTEGPAVLIEGEGDRGVTYGVYAFLERKLGVRWYEMMADGTVVPPHPVLALEPFDFSERPVLALRGFHDYESHGQSCTRRLFMIRNRLNVSELNFDKMDGRFVPRTRFHHPMHHQLFFFLPPEPKERIVGHAECSLVTNKGYFASHPDWYSLKGGMRVSDMQLCFTNPEMRREFLKNFLEFVEHKARTTGDAARHGYYAVGAMDTPGSLCDCESCRALEKRHDCTGAPYFDFVNWLCAELERRGYDLGIVVSAYRRKQTQKPPTGMKMHPKTLVSWAPIDADQSKTYDHPNNAPDVEMLRGWCALTRVYNRDYTWSYGPGQPPACPFGHLASGLRLAAELGCVGAWLEHAPGLITGANCTDMGTWVYTQLMRDPMRDWRDLAREYARARYGAAGDDVMDLVLELERLDRANPKHQLWSQRNELAQTAENLYRWQKAFDAMEEKLRDDRCAHDRLMELRESLDAETLQKYRAIRKTHPDFTATPEAIRDRLLDTLQLAYFRRSADYVPGERAKRKFTPWRTYVDAATEGYLLATREPKPLPPDLAALPPDRVMQFFIERRSQQPMAFDDEAAMGMATYIREPGRSRYHDDRAPIPFGLHDWKNKKNLVTRKIAAEEIEPDKFHLYRLGRTRVPSDDCRIHVGTSWGINTTPMAKAYEPGSDQEWDVYVSLKFTGPGFSPKSKAAKSEVFYDRTVFVKVEK